MAQKPKAIITQQRLEFSGSSASHQSASIHEDSGKLVFGASGSNYWEMTDQGNLKALTSVASNNWNAIEMNNNNIIGINTLRISDTGAQEGIEWYNGSMSNTANRQASIYYQSTYGNAGNDFNALTFWSKTYPFLFTDKNVGIHTDINGMSGSAPAALTIAGDVIFGTGATSGSLGTDVFQSGFAGKGFRISTGSDGKWGLTTDNLTVRGSMSVYELLLQQVRANNGAVWISSTGKVDSVEYKGSGTDFKLNFDSNNGAGHGFAVDDLIRAQRWNNASETTLLSNLQVTSIDGTGSLSASKIEGSDPDAGFEYVRIGNTDSGSGRSGAIYLTSDDGYAPYIDVIDGVTSHNAYSGSSQVKARFGNLSGITDATFGNLEGYGLYSENVFLTGGIKATVGEIGGWKIGANQISSSYITLNTNQDGGRITVGDSIVLKGDVTPSQIAGFYVNATDMWAGNSAEANATLIFGHTDTSTPKIALGTAADSMTINSGNNGFYVDGAGNIRIGSSTHYLRFSSSGLQLAVADINILAGNSSITTATMSLDATNIELSSQEASMSLGEGKIVLQGGSSYTNIKIGDSNAIKMESDGTDHYLVFGGKNSFAEFDQSTPGLILGTDNGNSKFEIVGDENNFLSFDSSSFNLKTENATISGSSVELGAETFNLSSTNLRITDEAVVGASGKITLSGGNNKIYVGGGITMDGGTNEGQIDVNSRVILNGTGDSQIAGWKIGSNEITKIDSSGGISIDAGNRIITARTGSASDTVRVRFGEVESGKYGIQGENATGTEIFNLGEQGNNIAGWTFDGSTLYKNNIYLVSNEGGKIVVGGNYPYSDSDAITLSGSGEGWLASKAISWDSSGNTIITGSVTIGDDVTIKGGLEVGALPALPAESDLIGYWSLDDLEPLGENLCDISESQFVGNETGSWGFYRYPTGTFGAGSYVKADNGVMEVGHQTGYDNSQTFATFNFTTQVNEVYHIAARCKWDGGSSNRALLDIYDGVTWQKAEHSGNGQWEDLEIIFLSKTAGTKTLRLALYNETGVAYYDDIKIQKYNTHIGAAGDNPTIYVDNSGNGNSGSVNTGTPKSSYDSISGKSIFFMSESQDEVQFHNTVNKFSIGDSFTLSVWAKRFHPTTASADPINTVDQSTDPGVNTNGTGLFMKGHTTNSVGLYYYFHPTNQIRASVRDSANNIKSLGYTMDDGGLNWHHYVMSYTPNSTSGIKLYVDGLLKASGSTTGIITQPSSSTEPLTLGGNNIGGGNQGYFNGFIDEPRAYKRVLTDNEIKSIYLNPTAQGSTVISGDQISTGRIKSNNLTANKGSELDLDSGTIKLGGTSTPKFAVDSDGAVTSSAGTIGGFNINESSISSSNDNLKLFDTGVISGSDVHFDGGTIGDWEIDSTNISSPGNGIVLNGGATPSMVIGGGAGIYIYWNSAGSYGIQNGITNPNFQLGTTNQIAGWNFNYQKLYVGTDETVSGYTTDSLIISSSGAIHSPQFYINSEGSASFKGDLEVGALPNLPTDEHLRAYYSFDSLTQGASFLLDSTGLNGNATLHNNAVRTDPASGPTGSYVVPPPRIVDGSSGLGLWFDGSIIATIPNPIGSVFNSGGYNSGKWAVSMWFKPPTSDSFTTNNGILFNAQAGYTNQYMLYHDADVNKVRFGLSGGNETSWYNLKSGQWNHIVAAVDGTNLKLYVNAELKETKTLGITIPNNVTQLIIGGDLDNSANANQAVSGALSEIRVYSTDVSFSEVEGLYANPAGNRGTLISGDQISTGEIKSNNWNDNNIGSLLDLNDGYMHLGGSGSNASLFFDGTNLSVEGTITSTDGEIGGWDINNYYIQATTSSTTLTIASAENLTTSSFKDPLGFSLYRTNTDCAVGETKLVRLGQIGPQDEVYLSGSTDYGLQIVQRDAADTFKDLVRFGKDKQIIAGWNIDSNTLYNSKVTMSSANGGLIALSSSEFGSHGIQLSGSGEFYVGNGSNRYFRFDDDGLIRFQTEHFILDTSTLDITTNSGGKVSLGSNSEIMLSGSGEGHLAGGKINFDKDGNLNISGASLTLDDSGTNLIPDYYDVANSKYVVMRDTKQYYGTFKPNTTITVLDKDRNVTKTIEVTNAYSLGEIVAGDITTGSIIEANHPISLYSTDTNGIPLNVIHKNYGTLATRYWPLKWKFYSPFVSASVTMSWGLTTGAYTSASVSGSTGGDSVGFILDDSTQADTDPDRYYSITSSVPVALYSEGNNSGDFVHCFPMAKELLWTDPTVTDPIEILSYGGQSFTRNVGIGISGAIDSGSSRHNVNGTSFYTSDEPIQLQANGDGNGGDAHQGIPLDHLGDTYMIAHPVGGYSVVSVEPCIVTAYKLDGVGGKTLIGTHDLSASTRTQPRYFCTGSHMHDWHSGVIGNIADTGMYLEGTAPFALRTNGPTDDGEYVVLGYRRNANPQYNSLVNYPWQPSDTTTISGDRIRTGKIESNNYSYSSGDFSTAGTKINLNDGTITSTGFAIDSSGNAAFEGNVKANSGEIGGWEVTGFQLKSGGDSPDQNISLDATNKKITINTASFGDTGIQLEYNGGTPRAHIGTDTEYFQFKDNKLSVETAPLKITSGGNLIISGTVTAGGGEIGGWTVGSTLSATNILLDPSTPKVTLGSKATLTDSNTGLYLGTDGLAAGANSVFKVTDAGVLSATSATITGNITATNIQTTSGSIAGWDISGDEISKGDSDGSGAAGHIRLRSATSVVGGNNYQDSVTKLRGLHLQWHESNNAGFLSIGDILTTPTGEPKVTSNVTFSNWMGIQAAKWNSNNVYFQLGFNVTESGAFSTHNEIAGWGFDESKIYKNNVVIDSANEKITLGSGEKIRLSGDGSGQLAGGNISWTDAGVVTIQNASVTITNTEDFASQDELELEQSASFALWASESLAQLRAKDDTKTPVDKANLSSPSYFNGQPVHLLWHKYTNQSGAGADSSATGSEEAYGNGHKHYFQSDRDTKGIVRVIASDPEGGAKIGFSAVGKPTQSFSLSQTSNNSSGLKFVNNQSASVYSNKNWELSPNLSTFGKPDGGQTGGQGLVDDANFGLYEYEIDIHSGSNELSIYRTSGDGWTARNVSIFTYDKNPSGQIQQQFADAPDDAGLFLGANNLGYYDSSAWKTYMSSSGQFFLTGTSGYLHWTPSSDTLEIKGTISASDGDIGGWDINTNYIQKGGIRIGQKYGTPNLEEIRISHDGAGTGDNNYVRMFHYSGSDGNGNGYGDYGIEGVENSNQYFFMGRTGSADLYHIAGWNFNSTTLTGGNITLNSEGEIHLSGSVELLGTVAGGRIQVGNTVQLNGTGNSSIAGWNVSDTTLWSDSNEIYLQSDNGGKLWMGAGTYDDGIIGFKGDGSGKLASGKINWDTGGNLTVSGAYIEINSHPILPSDSSLKAHWTFDSSQGGTINSGSLFDASDNGRDAFFYNAGGTAGEWTIVNDGVVGGALLTKHGNGGQSVGFECGLSLLEHNDVKDDYLQTYTFWYKPVGSGDDNSSTDRIMSRDASDYWAICQDSNGWSGGFADIHWYYKGNAGVDLVDALKAGEWHFIAQTLDYTNNESKLYVYRSGSIVANSTKTLNVPEAPDGSNNRGVTLGCNSEDAGGSGFEPGNSTNNVSGSFDEIRYYNTILTQNELDALYLNPAGHQGTKISGDQINTGGITSNNWSSTQGTLIDLDNEKIIIGGSQNESGLVDGIVLDASTTTPKFYVGDASSYIRFNNTANALEINTPDFSIDNAGTVTMTGTVNASGGTFSGYITAGGAMFGQNVNGTTHDGLYLDDYNYVLDVNSGTKTFRFGDSTSYLLGTGGNIGIHMGDGDDFILNTSTFDVNTSGDGGNGVITLGSDSQIQLSGSGGGHLAGGKIKWTNSGDLTISGSTFEVNDFPILPDDNRLMYYADFNGDEIIDVTGRNTGSMTYDNAPTFTQGTGSIVGRGLQQTANHDIRVPYQQETADVLQSQNFTWTMWVTVNGESNWRDFISFPILYQTASETPTSTTWRFEHSKDNEGTQGSHTGSSTSPDHFGLWFGTYNANGNYPALTTPYNTDGLNLHQTYFVALVSSKDDGHMKAYVDGELIDTETDNFGTITSIPTHEFRIFDGGNTGDTLDEFRVYSGSLSANEIRALYLNPAGNKGTKISGDNVTTGKLISNNYDAPDDGAYELFADAGTKINLDDGEIVSKGFKIESNGDAYFAGNLTAGATNTTFDSTKGLQAYWKFDRTHQRTLGGVTWDYVHDQSGHGLDLYLKSGVTFGNGVNARTGSSMANLQNGDYGFVRGNDVNPVIGTVASSSQVFNQQYGEHTGSMAVSVWFKPSANPTSQRQVIVSHRENSGWALEYQEDEVWFVAHDGIGYRYAKALNDLQSGTWYHIVGVFNGKDRKIYCWVTPEGYANTYPNYEDDAALDASSDGSLFFVGNRNLIVGDEAAGEEWDSISGDQIGEAHATGYIDELRIYNVALTKGEAEALFLGKEVTGNMGTISADRLAAGTLKSLNLSTDAGSQFNLNDGTFELGGTSAPKLSWDGEELFVKGDIQVGGRNNPVIDVDFSKDLPSTQFSTHDINQTQVTGCADGETLNGTGSWFQNTVSSAWTAGIWTHNNVWSREEGATFEVDFIAHAATPTTMVGFVEEGFDLDDMQYASNYQHQREGIYIQNSEINIRANGGIDKGQITTDGSDTDEANWVAGTSTHYRVRCTMNPNNTATYTVWKTKTTGGVPDYSNPMTRIINTGDTTNKVRFAIHIHSTNSFTSQVIFQRLKIYNSGNSIGGTTISGDNISTGNIKSNTWDKDVRGTQISLDEGEIRAKGNSGDGWFLNTTKGNFDFSVGGIPATDSGITWEDTNANQPMAGSGTSGGSSYMVQDQQDSPA